MSNKKQISKNLVLQENNGSISANNGGFVLIHNPKQGNIPALYYFQHTVQSAGEIYIQVEFDYINCFTIRIGQFQSKMQIPQRTTTLNNIFSAIAKIAKRNGLQLSPSRFVNKKNDKTVKLADVKCAKQCNLKHILNQMEKTLEQFVNGVNGNKITI